MDRYTLFIYLNNQICRYERNIICLQVLSKLSKVFFSKINVKNGISNFIRK